MTSDSAIEVSTTSQNLSPVNCNSHIRLRNDGQKLSLYLPPQGQNEGPIEWSEMLLSLKSRLNSSERTWSNGAIAHLNAGDRLLDSRQIQSLATLLLEVGLELKSVNTSRRQTAVAAATAGYNVEQQVPLSPVLGETSLPVELSSEPLYLQTTIRSGVEIRHPGTVIVKGDVNPGGKITARGDILVWGCLRGIAHAGAEGNRECRIMALRLEPTQLRIADVVARAPQTPPEQLEPEVAYITVEGIRIQKAFAMKNTSFAGGERGLDKRTKNSY